MSFCLFAEFLKLAGEMHFSDAVSPILRALASSHLFRILSYLISSDARILFLRKVNRSTTNEDSHHVTLHFGRQSNAKYCYQLPHATGFSIVHDDLRSQESNRSQRETQCGSKKPRSPPPPPAAASSVTRAPWLPLPRCRRRLSCRGVGILLIVLTTLAIGIHVAKMEFSYQFGQIRNKKLELPPSGPMPKPYNVFLPSARGTVRTADGAASAEYRAGTGHANERSCE